MIYNITESYSILDNPVYKVLHNIRETINEFEYDIELYNRGYLIEADNSGEKRSILRKFIDFCKSIIDYIKSVPGKIRKMMSRHKGSSEEKKKLSKAEQKAENLKQEKIKDIEKEVEYINKLKEDDDKYIEEVIKRFNRVKQIANDFDKGIIDTGIMSKEMYDNLSVYTIIDKNNPDYGYKLSKSEKRDNMYDSDNNYLVNDTKAKDSPVNNITYIYRKKTGDKDPYSIYKGINYRDTDSEYIDRYVWDNGALRYNKLGTAAGDTEFWDSKDSPNSPSGWRKIRNYDGSVRYVTH